ncbi:MAG: 5-(carboxyamino)imidazole ribonucleotide synthase [Leptolyngbya sp. RL_3_1]|nr:5-(carboxyamino)imidazole ribonucleotide synthase [Leptolyngbya sp. RL_3_1]
MKRASFRYGEVVVLGLPMERVGIIGGGQLAWMMAAGAQRLGLDLVVQTPHLEDPAVAIAQAVIQAPVADAAATGRLAQQCDVISFENEFVDLAALAPLAEQGIVFRPQLTALAPLLDKYDQRQCLQAAGLPNPRYVTLSPGQNPAEVEAAAAPLGWPLVVKTRRLGYDGQGTFVVKTWPQLQARWEQMGCPEVLIEEFIPFEKELAVMVARGSDGQVVVYPTVETQQVNQVCRRVIAPAAVSEPIQATVARFARTLVEHLDYVGVLGMELFLAPGDRLLVNEVAPRTHNSGHYTLDACETSQFEQQLRAVSGRPLGPAGMTCDRAVMVNLLGFETAHHDYGEVRSRLAQIPNAHLSWYGKAASRPGRKLGHVTVTMIAAMDVAATIAQLEALWYPA